MIKRLRIENFKGWEDTGVIRMAPLTLFFGANSSGKSSLGQFLMMLKQTAESPDRRAVLHPGGQHSVVQLGSFRQMVYHHDPSRKISFEYSWSLPEPLRFHDPVSEHVFAGDCLVFSATVRADEHAPQTMVLEQLKYELWQCHTLDSGTPAAGLGASSQTPQQDQGVIGSSTEGRQCDVLRLAVGMQRKAGPQAEFTVDSTAYPLRRIDDRLGQPGAPVRFYGFPDEVVAYHQNAQFVQALNFEHEKLFRSLSYLGPLRTRTQRLYSWTGIEPDSVGSDGENTIAAILAAKHRQISLIDPASGRPQAAQRFEEVIASKLQQMGLIDAFQLNPLSDLRQEYEVKVRTKGSSQWVDLPDVGFGISQVLPVLVQCFYAPPGSIVLMEQPEVHLHPSAQSALADVMIDALTCWEQGAARNLQLIIETHSEHFLRRLQRRIAESVLPDDAVVAYFANTSQTPATLDPLQIDVYGNIQNWPENFFGDEMSDITQQAKAAMQKRRQRLVKRPGDGQRPEAP